MLDQETIAQQLNLLATHRRTLTHLIAQAAQYGGEVFAPPQTSNGIAEARAEIVRIKAALRAGGVAVEDEPNDDFLPIAGAAHSHMSLTEQRNRSRMLDRVETFWIRGILDQSLYEVVRMAFFLDKIRGMYLVLPP